MSGLSISPFVLLGLANTFTEDQALSSAQSGSASDSPLLTLKGWGGTAAESATLQMMSSGTAVLTVNSSANEGIFQISSNGLGTTWQGLIKIYAYGSGYMHMDVLTPSFAANALYLNTSGFGVTGLITANTGISIPSGESITGAGSLDLTGTGEFGGLFTAAKGIDITGTGGTHTAAIDLTSIGTASPYIDGDGNFSYPNATTGDSWNIYDKDGTAALAVTVDGTKIVEIPGEINFEGTTATTATAGTITPVDIEGFVDIQVGGTAYKLAYYAV